MDNKPEIPGIVVKLKDLELFPLDESAKEDMDKQTYFVTRLIQKELWFDCYPAVEAPGWKPLWRMSKGNRAKAVEIMEKTISFRYPTVYEGISKGNFDYAFDYATASIDGNCEIEWLS